MLLENYSVRGVSSVSKAKARCCFCGQPVPAKELVLLKLLNPNEDCIVKEQLFYSHIGCVRCHFDSSVLLPVLPTSETG